MSRLLSYYILTIVVSISTVCANTLILDIYYPEENIDIVSSNTAIFDILISTKRKQYNLTPEMMDG